MKLNATIIRKDFLGSKRRLFENAFPELKAEGEQLVKKPSCSTCIRGYFTKLFELTDVIERLTKIYGEQVELNKEIKMDSPKMKQVSEVHRVPIDEWEEWFKKNTTSSPNRQIRLFSNFYDSDKKEVVVSMVVLVQERG
jgi:hypothetical protein